MKFLILIGTVVSCIVAQQQNEPNDTPITDTLKKDTISLDEIGVNARNRNVKLQSVGTPDLSPNLINNNSCECVIYYLCNDGIINVNGMGIFTIRFGDDNPCEDKYSLCCSKPNITTESINRNNVILNATDRKCGKRNENGVGYRITGSDADEAEFGEFPWMVIVLAEDAHEQTFNYKCGGSLIHPNVVLTATHCVRSKSLKYKIRAGEWDKKSHSELYSYQDRDVKTVITHPQFRPGGVVNDIALLILDSPVDITHNVDTICLPFQNQSIEDSRCVATGWGKTSLESSNRDILKKIDLPIVPKDVCENNLRKTSLGEKFQLDRSVLCAGGESGKDTCKGDGGGPLVCQIPGNPKQYFQAGIIAWGLNCGQPNVPALYTNVPSFMDWINEELSHYNIDSSYYTSDVQ